MRPVGVDDGAGQEPLSVVRHLPAAVSGGAFGHGGLGFPTMSVGGRIACTTRLYLIGAGLTAFPLCRR
jgi:hypothetical protein